ncbi:MAG: capsule assembly Wzi family protein [Bacteroidota bacterium]
MAQTMPVGLLDRTDDIYRRQQLLGIDSLKSSFMIRPLFYSSIPESKLLWKNDGLKASLSALPIVWQQQYNSHHPYGTNDGAMISAKGYQTLLSAGVFAKIGPLSIQLRPEFVYASNDKFTQTFEAANEPSVKKSIIGYHNTVDAPERLGDGAYQKLSWGQSSIRLNFDPVSIGLSNENLWWGPGEHNSLLMSNNAPGFKHLTLNTTRPVNTPIGAFEAQLIAGRLEGSGINYPEMVVKRADWRYLSGVVLVYQPKWVPGLFLGFDRTFTTYHQDLGNKLGDYLPFFSSLEKSSFQTGNVNTEDNRKRDQLFSLFAKWVMPEARAEVYVQYGKEDHNWNLRDLFVEPENSRAYIAGFRKLMPYKGKNDEFIQFGLEFTQMEAGNKSIRNSSTWYTHGEVKHGYTHQGQFLGAGIGPDNMQSVDVAWVKDFKRIGFSIERRVHNNSLYYRMFGNQLEPRRHWVDLGLGTKFDWSYKRFILNSQLVYSHSLNYQYRIANQDPNLFWKFDQQDVNNLQAKVGIMYRL